MTCPAAQLYLFLLKKRCNEDDVSKILKNCFSPDEVAKINKVSCNGPLAVLKGKYHLDMTDVVKNSQLFDIDRGVSREEKLSRAQ